MLMFKKKINVLLILCLCLSLAACGDKDSVTVPDFTGKTVDDVNTWCNDFESNPCIINYDYSDSIATDYVIYQSLEAEQELSGKISFIISLGIEETIEVPSFENSSKDTVVEWASENGVTNISYVEKESNVIEKGYVISVEPNGTVAKSTNIIVYISTGKSEETISNSITVTANAFVNYTVKQFESKVAELGLEPEHTTKKDAYSDTVPEGYVVWHGSGDYIKGETIHYGLSLGEDKNSIKVEKGTYINKTETEFKEAVAKLGEKGLTASHDETWDAYSSTVTKGNIVAHGSGSYAEEEEIHYGLSLGAKDGEIIVTEAQYIGKTYTEFETAVNALGLVAYHKTDWDEETTDTTKVGNISKNGYGTYENGENCSYGLYVADEDAEITITSGTYVGKTYTEFETAITALGLTPYHRTEWDQATTDSTKVGSICSHGSGTYVYKENCSYGLYTASSTSSSEITITKNQYVGKTYSEFETAVKALGLGTYHKESWDETTTDSTKVGCICFNGYGTYTSGENCSYGLYTSSSSSTTITITQNQYQGYTEADYKSAMTALGLTPEHNSAWDAYSDTVDAGKIVRNGYGSYTKGETARYGLSLGVKATVKTVSISASAYNNKTEAEFKTAITALNLTAYHDVNKDEYSSTITKGNIVYHASGSFNEGSNVAYGLSLGTKSLYINSKNFYNTNYIYNNYADMKSKMTTLLSGFSNVTYEEVQSANTEIGQIEYIKINGSTSYDPGSFASDTPIVVGIVSSKKPS